jgi:uncharacterized protein involved in propanediol utilization
VKPKAQCLLEPHGMDHNSQATPSKGWATAHHGEILQGIFRDPAGLRRALVTLQCPDYESRAIFYPCPGKTGITAPPGMWKVHNAATSAMATFATERSPVVGGCVYITSTVPRGIGMGSSTADVTATIRAIAKFHGATPSAEEIARVAVRAELASDSIMIDDRVALFAHRDGVVLESFGPRLPPMLVIGCRADPGADEIDTVALTPAAYSPADVRTFGNLRAELRAAIASGDVARLGSVATASAEISQRFLAKPSFECLLDICRCCDGCGVQVAHSGTVAGIIFDPMRAGVTERVERCIDQITKAGLPLTGIIRGSIPSGQQPEHANSVEVQPMPCSG